MTLLGPAFTIALLGAIESLLSASAADGTIGTRHQAYQALIGKGISEYFCSTFYFSIKGSAFMDITGLETFRELMQQYYKRGVNISLREANTNVCKKLHKAGILRWSCEVRIFSTLAEALKLT